MYFWITSGEDGTSVRVYGREGIEARLKSVAAGHECATFLQEVPREDKGCWTNVPEDAVVIIHGDIVIPKETKRVTELSLP